MGPFFTNFVIKNVQMFFSFLLASCLPSRGWGGGDHFGTILYDVLIFVDENNDPPLPPRRRRFCLEAVLFHPAGDGEGGGEPFFQSLYLYIYMTYHCIVIICMLIYIYP